MSNKQIIEKFFASMVAQDWTTLTGLVTSSTVLRFPDGTEHVGTASIVEVCKEWVGAFSDINPQLVDVIESGNTLVSRIHLTGTNDGTLVTPMGDVPATGRSIDIWPIDWVVFENGKITEWIVSFDQVTMLGQLGLLPEPAAV